jgi:hypothetical protein
MVELLHSMSIRPSEQEIDVLFNELDWSKDGSINCALSLAIRSHVVLDIACSMFISSLLS